MPFRNIASPPCRFVIRLKIIHCFLLDAVVVTLTNSSYSFAGLITGKIQTPNELITIIRRDPGLMASSHAKSLGILELLQYRQSYLSRAIVAALSRRLNIHFGRCVEASHP